MEVPHNRVMSSRPPLAVDRTQAIMVPLGQASIACHYLEDQITRDMARRDRFAWERGHLERIIVVDSLINAAIRTLNELRHGLSQVE